MGSNGIRDRMAKGDPIGVSRRRKRRSASRVGSWLGPPYTPHEDGCIDFGWDPEVVMEFWMVEESVIAETPLTRMSEGLRVVFRRSEPATAMWREGETVVLEVVVAISTENLWESTRVEQAAEAQLRAIESLASEGAPFEGAFVQKRCRGCLWVVWHIRVPVKITGGEARARAREAVEAVRERAEHDTLCASDAAPALGTKKGKLLKFPKPKRRRRR